MSNEKVSELYGEYQHAMKSLVADDEYYVRLMDAIGSGQNSFSLFNRYFEKKIDLRWVDAIEACIIPLDTIIRNPRKFIVQEEEIVPIERARKITAESVRHLAQHTSMIARVEGDKVTPSQILNVFREESFEIYENRFIFTLLRNLQRFIDQRYDVLFSLSNDESMASIKMNSEIENGNEKIIYKLEMSTQAVEDHREADDINDTKDASAFQRIERIKRIVNEFAHSAFMRDLQGCTPVRPPIMRTNVISKDVNFRACLELWQFISSYSDVGYEIISKETDEMVSDEYRDDLYRVFATNYLLLKNNIVAENEVVGKVKKRKIKPKMLKRLAEELVLDYDMEEVEIRKIFIDEMKRVSKKKIAGEEKVRAAITRALASEDARKAEIEEKIKAEIQRKKDIERERKERERARIAKEKALEKERIAKQKAREKAKKERAIALAKEQARKEKERIRIAKEKELLRQQQEKERQAKLVAAAKAKKEKERLAEEQRKAKKLAMEQAKKEREKLKQQQEKERIAQQKAKKKEKERLAREAALQLQKEKEAAAKAKEKERQAQIKAAQLEKEKLAKAKQKEKERLAREAALQLQKEKAAAEKAKEKEQQAKLKAAQAEKDRIAKEKLKAKEQLEREKQKEKERIAHEKAVQAAKDKAAADKAKEKERQARIKAAQAEKDKADREKLREKERIAREKQKEKERIAREKQKEKERIAREKLKEKERQAKLNANNKATATKKADAETEETK